MMLFKPHGHCYAHDCYPCRACIAQQAANDRELDRAQAAACGQPLGEADAIATWLEEGCKRPNTEDFTHLEPETYLKVARLIREGWWRR